MKNILKMSLVFVFAVMMAGLISRPAAAEEMTAAADAAQEQQEDNATSTKALAAGIAIAVVASVGAAAMGISISKSSEAIARQPEAAGNIRSSMMLGLVFIETAIIYALIVAILIVFVL